MKYILVGTYKTKPESKGWYVSQGRYRVLWEKINGKFDRRYTHEHCAYNDTFGTVGDLDGFFFYDLKTHDQSMGTVTKDKEVFKAKREDFILGLSKLMKEVESNPKIKYRVGLQGNNTVGLVLNYISNPDRLDKVLLGSIAKDFRHHPFGMIKGMELPDNLELFKIYNLTQPARRKEDMENLFHKTWNEFLEIE